MVLIRKHASLLALLASLLGILAASYLIPENPDSAVFRSGLLGTLLMLVCAVPIKEALLTANRRTLVSSAVFGLLLGGALSLGAELRFYEGLLPGMGSMIRRLAVPVLATPMLGGLTAWLLSVSPAPVPEYRRHPLPFWVFALVILLCWVPVLLAFWPGMINYDFPGDYGQHLVGQYSKLHPLFHSVLVNGIITLGERLIDRTFGLLLSTLMQMILLACALGYSCSFVQRRGVPTLGVVGMTALYGLLPIFSVMSVSTSKDALFAASVLVFSLRTWALIEDPKAFLNSRRACIGYVVLAVCSALMRKNGVSALAFMLPALLIVLRTFRKRVCVLILACAVACTAVNGLLTLALHPVDAVSFQLYSIPAQQLVRAAGSGRMSEEDLAELHTWYLDTYDFAVCPHLADGAKGYLDRERIEAEGADFLKLWARHSKAFAREYAEAFLMLNVGSWYPDDLSHASVYRDASYNDKGYLQLQESDLSEYGFHTTSYLPAVRNLFERICRRNYYQKYPLISVLFSTATPLWVLLLSCTALVARKKARYLPAVIGVLTIWLFYLFGPCTLPRYIMPLFCLAPPLFALSYTQLRDAFIDLGDPVMGHHFIEGDSPCCSKRF